MPHYWWTRKNLVLAAVAALAFAGFIMIGVSDPEPAAGAALGPDWHCSRLAFVSHDLQPGQAERGHDCPPCQNAGVRAAADVIGSGYCRFGPEF